MVGNKNGVYEYNEAQEKLSDYKHFLEEEMKSILEKYSVGFWLHVSRRIAPNSSGEDDRAETVRICRNIVNAGIQKFALLKPCGSLRRLSEVGYARIFNGLLLKPEFEQDLVMAKTRYKSEFKAEGESIKLLKEKVSSLLEKIEQVYQQFLKEKTAR